jgi:CRISPR-associated endonuclease/helicase Cas3
MQNKNAQDYLSYWGKARPVGSDGPRWHPLAWHSLDVAACAEALVAGHFPSLAARLAALAKTREEPARQMLARLAALHDIGKFSIGFQIKAPEHFPSCLVAPEKAPDGDHAAIGLCLLQRELAPLKARIAPGLDVYAWNALVAATAGHHGRPATPSKLTEDEIGRSAVEAARAFADDMLAVIGGDPFPGALTDAQVKPFTYLLAGLINLADWIGSDQARFPYERPEMSVAQYWETIARDRARKALAAAGLGRCAISAYGGFEALTGRTDYCPSPLQSHAETVELPAGGPCFFIVEDLTGAGKTEAALILAHRLMQSGRGDGLFVALPTMATANAMYARLSTSYRRLFDAGESPSLALAHGAARLHDGFRDSILEIGRNEAPYGDGSGDDDIPASASCAAWIGREQRRAFFADVGAGAIDQTFLSVLPVKFAALRMLGLSRRVLILDEIHSYEAYESEELCRLIQFHAARGGSVIALSATLPETVKDGLVKAWRLGLRIKHKPAAWLADYPLCSIVDGEGEVSCAKVNPRRDLPRTVKVERLADEAEALEAILAGAKAGACVAWVRNTVDDVLAAHKALAARGAEARVFHARFAMCDRQKIEAEVVAAFGPDMAPEKRRGQIIVASQVIEQSLDLDFDLMISDLAPIDLLIQRAGRLWRHPRGDRPLPAPRLLVVSPEPLVNAGTGWLSASMRGASYVYRNHAAMWRTAKVLFEAGEIVSPAGVRPLVEAVYGPDALDSAPGGLQGRRVKAEGEANAGRSLARLNLLKLQDGYSDAAVWAPEIHTPTRLGEERTIFRLARWKAGKLQPWAGDISAGLSPREQERLWALSEVAVRQGRASGRGDGYPPDVERAAVALETAWNEKGGGRVALPVLGEADGGEARMSRGEGKQETVFRVLYNTGEGVVFSPGQ